MTQRVVVVGGGLGGLRSAEQLRAAGFASFHNAGVVFYAGHKTGVGQNFNIKISALL